MRNSSLSASALIIGFRRGMTEGELYGRAVECYDALVDIIEYGAEDGLSALMNLSRQEVAESAEKIVHALLFNALYDPFVSLGIRRDAAPNEAKARWKRLIGLYHPDRAPGRGGEEAKRINEAYDKVKMAVRGKNAVSRNEVFEKAVFGKSRLGVPGIAVLRHLPAAITLGVFVFAVFSVFVFLSARENPKSRAGGAENTTEDYAHEAVELEGPASKKRPDVDFHGDAEKEKPQPPVRNEDGLADAPDSLTMPEAVDEVEGPSPTDMEAAQDDADNPAHGALEYSAPVVFEKSCPDYGPGFFPEEIEEFLSDYRFFYETGNLGSFISLFSKDAMENGKPVSSLTESYRRLFAGSLLRYRMGRAHIKIKGDSAAEVSAPFRIERFVIEEGQTYRVEGNIRWTLGKGKDGLRILRVEYD